VASLRKGRCHPLYVSLDTTIPTNPTGINQSKSIYAILIAPIHTDRMRKLEGRLVGICIYWRDEPINMRMEWLNWIFVLSLFAPKMYHWIFCFNVTYFNIFASQQEFPPYLTLILRIFHQLPYFGLNHAKMKPCFVYLNFQKPFFTAWETPKPFITK
jgi:hypothetical protein